MKTTLTYLCILVGLAALVASTSVKLSEWIRNERTCHLHIGFWWGEPRGKWGDLTNMAYLDMVRQFCEPNTYDFHRPAATTAEKNIDLYLYGDSYTRDVPKEALANVDNFQFIPRIGSFDFVLNPNKRNILILELSERYLRGRFKDTGLTDCIRIHAGKEQIPGNTSVKMAPKKEPTAPAFSIRNLFNPNINQNLEYHLFNYKFLLLPRQVKAAINYKLFNRASGDVVISENGKHLFFKPTVGTSVLSSYYPIRKHEAAKLVGTLNKLYDHFKRAGFDEIYFSVIPNSASILQPEYYNKAIPLVQYDPKMKMPCIDMYGIFSQHSNPETLLRAGDTHWNNNGMQKWLQLVNNILIEESKKR